MKTTHGRLARALDLIDDGEAERIEEAIYRVHGYIVDLNAAFPCYCEDSRFRPWLVCKHRFAAVHEHARLN